MTPTGIPIGAPTGVTPEVASHVLHHYGEGGYEAGSFTRQLIATVAAADPINMARLGLGFPEYVAAVRLANNFTEGIAILRAIADTPTEASALPKR